MDEGQVDSVVILRLYNITEQ
ncbi:uncharacterized protein G2W53_044052 [Senna tora]|uniref:Uncharacterized protein n=1 Tax=Senna tora TaxID=362788 RepID=A0A834SK98_9FABA|nr:uncharacterized protein G2W53_044052 [Senna tora]